MVHLFSKRVSLLGSLSLIGLTIGLASGCSNAGLENQILEQAKTAPQFRIGMVTIKEPKLYEAKVFQYRIPNPTITIPGRVASMGMISAGKGLDKLAANYNFTEMLKENDFRLSERLSTQLRAELEKVGYEVVDTPVNDHRHASDFRGGFCLNAPVMSEPCSNYFLHVVVDFAGYTAFTLGQPYVPMLQLRVRLISVTGESAISAISDTDFITQEEGAFKLIYAATFTYGGAVPVDGPTDVPFSPKFALRGRNDLDNSKRIMAGLEDASQELAKRIAMNLQ
ncbi:MAG: hypothetical protein KUG76_02190 [Gammaproteobacteria bacterium]|nr:hypothetical protein [Gammaproteobacteria bacterium]